MAAINHQLGPENANTVSAVGLRWAALRGMLASPLIEAEEQQALRAELLRELGTINRDLAGVAARNAAEVAAKIDIVRTALQEAGIEDGLSQLLDSVKADALTLLPASRPRPERPGPHLVRSPTWAMEGGGVNAAAAEQVAE